MLEFRWTGFPEGGVGRGRGKGPSEQLPPRHALFLQPAAEPGPPAAGGPSLDSSFEVLHVYQNDHSQVSFSSEAQFHVT